MFPLTPQQEQAVHVCVCFAGAPTVPYCITIVTYCAGLCVFVCVCGCVRCLPHVDTCVKVLPKVGPDFNTGDNYFHHNCLHSFNPDLTVFDN